MNSEICFDACRNIYGKSSSTFWGIFIKIPKLIPRVATLLNNNSEASAGYLGVWWKSYVDQRIPL